MIVALGIWQVHSEGEEMKKTDDANGQTENVSIDYVVAAAVTVYYFLSSINLVFELNF